MEWTGRGFPGTGSCRGMAGSRAGSCLCMLMILRCSGVR